MQVDKVIHYCWFGQKEKPESVKKMISSWKKYCPDYKIIEWNEDNSNLQECLYVKQAYENKKYAFVADYVRMKVLYEQGGVYLDTDVELTKNIDQFLENDMTISFQDDKYINTGLIITKPKNSIIKKMIEYYQTHNFVKEDMSLDMKTNVSILTDILLLHGLQANNTNQQVEGITILTNDYFAPLNFQTRVMKKTENTHAIHWFDATWLSTNKRIQLKLKRCLRRIIGEEKYSALKSKFKK